MHTPTTTLSIDPDRSIVDIAGIRMYPIIDSATSEYVGRSSEASLLSRATSCLRYPSNTSILGGDMDQITLTRWAKKLGNGDIGKGMAKAKWIMNYALYTGTMIHRSFERGIKLAKSDEVRTDWAAKHIYASHLPSTCTVVGSELQLIGDGYATTLDLVYADDKGFHIVDFKTLHRVTCDEDEGYLDCPQEREMQGYKKTKYFKQLAAQYEALKFNYGIEAVDAEVWAYNTVTFTLDKCCLINTPAMFAKKMAGFNKLKEKLADDLEDMV
jgi:hypothetical protein